MALTTNDLHTALAYRLGETSTPNDSTTKAIRLEWMNQGYFNLARRRNWWWLEATDTTNTNTGSTSGYTEPTGLKEFIELKVGDGYYDQIPYKSNRLGSTSVVTLPKFRLAKQFYRFGGKYFFTETDNADGTVHTIKFYKRVIKTADGGTFLVPDEYLEALVAYAEARYWLSITQQAKAVVPFQEYEEMFAEMNREQNRRGTGWSGFGIGEPEDQFGD